MIKVVCERCGTSFLPDVIRELKNCPVCGEPMWENGEDSISEDGHPDWITWYYYKDPKYGDHSLWDKLPLRPEELELIKEFKAPPRDSKGSSEKAKEILRTYVPDAFSEPKDKKVTICCPRCGSQEFTLLNRGYSIFTGFLGSGRVKRVCNRCKKEF